MGKKKIRVAVIDSGADTENPVICSRIIEGYDLLCEKTSGQKQAETRLTDGYGHGTNCIDLIYNICPNTVFYPIKIVDNYGKTRSDLLTQALRQCLLLPVKVICVSIAAQNQVRELQNEIGSLQDICLQLDKQGKIICVSENNNFKNSVPAIYPSTLGVGQLENESNYLFEVNRTKNIQVKADITPVFVHGKNGKYNFFKGTSKANAYITGVVANTILRFGDMNKNEIIIMLETIRIERNAIEICKNTVPTDPETKELLKKIEFVLKKTNPDIKLDELGKSPFLSKNTGLTFFNVYDFIRELYSECGIVENDYHNLRIGDICTLPNLIKHLKEKK